MNIEELVPRETAKRDAFIRNIIIPDESINYLGLYFTDIVFKFKIDKPLYESYNYIECEGIELFNLEGGLIWRLVTDNVNEFLPKEFLLKNWKLS
jgi:hypothetical protein